MGGFVPIFAVAGLINDEHAAPMGGRRGIGAQHFQASGRYRRGVPGRFTEKPLQPLHRGVLRPNQRFGIRQRRQGLIAFGRQEQPGQVLAKPCPLIGAGKQIIELRGVRLQGLWDRRDCEHGGHLRPDPPTLASPWQQSTDNTDFG